MNSFTWENARGLTWDDLKNVSWNELSQSCDDLLQQVRNDNRKVTVNFYEKLVSLCEETSQELNQPIEKPKSMNIADVVGCISNLVKIASVCIPKIKPIINDAINFIKENF